MEIEALKRQLADISGVQEQIEFLRLQEPHPELLHILGMLYSREEQYDLAYKAFAEAVYRNPKQPGGHLFRQAACLFKTDNLKAALPLFEAALKQLDSNRLFKEFFQLAGSCLTRAQALDFARLFAIRDQSDLDLLEENPLLLYSFIAHQPAPDPGLARLLNLKVVNRQARRTIICFTSRSDRPNALKYQLTHILPRYDSNLIYIRDPHDAWYLKGLAYLTQGVADTAAFLRAELAELHPSGQFELYTTGCSAGGFAALLYGNLLGARRMAAFSPQTFLPRPGYAVDAKCLKEVDPAYFDLLAALNWDLNPDSRLDLFYSEEMLDDRDACERFQHVRGARLHPYPAGREHNIAAWLKNQNLLAGLLDECFEG